VICSATACGSSGSGTAPRSSGVGGAEGDVIVEPGGMGGGAAGEAGAPDGSGGHAAVDAGLPACTELDIGFEKVTPTIMLLVDQSTSMGLSFYASKDSTRWEILQSALLKVLQPLQSDVRLGLTLYRSKVGNQGGTCPILTKVPAALNNFDAISAKFKESKPGGDSPTGESLAQAAADLLAYEASGPKFVLLATDGEPDTCAMPNPQTGQAEVIHAAGKAYENGIGTFVIGVSTEITDAHLQDVANAGAGLPVGDVDGGAAQNAPFYHPTDAGSLADAIETVINQMRTCVFHLGNTVDVHSAATGHVVLDGMPLKFQDANGWRLNSSTDLEVLGKACDRIKTDAKEIQISFPCAAVVN
jgi:hypothetical protein